MTNIIQGKFGPPPKAQLGNPNPTDPRQPDPPAMQLNEGAAQLPQVQIQVDGKRMNPEQEKAINLIMSGLPFVFLGLKPVDGGCDFFTALHGEPSDLRNAHSELPAVINRLFHRKGILA